MKTKFVVCISNEDYAASLEPRKLYKRIEDKTAGRHGQIRVIDESGDDYLYPEYLFKPVSLSREVEESL